MEISPQHHSIVLGKQSSNLKMIMQRTGTQIMFPDAGDPNIPSLKKSNVTITGGIHNVYLARQQLVVGHVCSIFLISNQPTSLICLPLFFLFSLSLSVSSLSFLLLSLSLSYAYAYVHKCSYQLSCALMTSGR